MQRLDISTFPLHGTRLIEASAGTGKTFTLTALYLRLLLEGGLDISRLLVVTFTEAATEELRGRIRTRLRQAAAGFDTGTGADPVVADLLARLDDHPARAQQLRDAVTRLDEAAIFTIHGFCRRMLTEHAFESGVLFDTELTADERALREAVINDFWRRRFYPGDGALAAWVTRRWSAPDKLLRALEPWLRNTDPRVLPEVDETGLRNTESALRAARAQAESAWAPAEIEKLLLQAEGLGRAAGTYRRDRVEALIEAASAYFSQADVCSVPPELEALTPPKLAAALTATAVKRGVEAPRHPFFDRCKTLVDRARELDVLREAAVLEEAAEYLRTTLGQRKRETRQWAYNDLLVDLDKALSGPGGKRLADAIRARFPAALVDEFQDTDPLQYRIFASIYRDTADAAGAWFMIGDPKQAIYGFRGADIFTYIQARHDTDPRSEHFTLDTNWRSATRLVEAVNALFGGARAPFIFDDDIRFHPVRAAGEADNEPLRVDDDAAPAPLNVWFVEQRPERLYHGTISKKWAFENVASACAGEIARLIDLGRQGRARLGERALSAADLAVLVRDRYEAAAMRRALADAGVNSVYFSRDSVFASPEALALEHVLAAVAEPGHERRLRAALATDLVGASAHALAAGDDDPGWLDWLTCFQAYHDIWMADGFMPFFQRFLREQDVAARLLARPQGERRLTNLLQLGELTQAASETVWGMEALLRWLGEHIRHPDGDAEDQQMRLESDAGLVKIVTIHKSKGLEYPVVFLPFIWGSRVRPDRCNGRPAAVEFHDPADRAYTLDFGSARHAAHHGASERERLAEDLRLLYVALTRACHCCYLTWGRFFGAAESALGHLLHPAADGEPIGAGMKGLDDAALRAPWEALETATHGAIRIRDLPGAGTRLAPRAALVPDALRARRFAGSVPRGWRIASYSGLIEGLETVAATAPFAPEAPDYDAVDMPADTSVSTPQPARPFSSIFHFPRGARAGTFMHALLERVDFPAAAPAELADLAERMLQRHGFDPRWKTAMADMVASVLDTPLGEGGRLREVSRERRQVEMEFYFPLREVGHDALNRFIAAYRAEHRGPALSFGTVAGMMKGFIDLVFAHAGRYFIVDYKSNHLGDRAQDYRSENLAHAIRAHHYDLQYLIYTVALHRYLAQRVPGYDYAQHFGGVYYLFLRGMDAQGGGVFHDCPAQEQVEALDRLFAGG